MNSASRFPAYLFLFMTGLGSIPAGSAAADEPPRRMAPDVDRLVRWLPEDTENLAVARSFTLARPDPEKRPTWQELGTLLGIGDLDSLGKGKYAEPLLGRKVAWAVSGGKNYESVSSFGSLRSEGCAIIAFDADLGAAAGEWLALLRKDARSVRTLVGREVFVFPSAAVMEPWYKEKEWQATYFVLLDPRTVLCATSDRYLEAVLRRVDAVPAPPARALPDDLPEWRHVDLVAPVWFLRHRPGAKAVGCTIRFTPDGFRVVYVPRAGKELDQDLFEPSWRAAGGSGQAKHLQVGRGPDGTITVAGSQEGLTDPATLGWGFNLYWLQGGDFESKR